MTETSIVVTVTQPSILIVSHKINEIVDHIQMTFQPKMSSVLESNVKLNQMTFQTQMYSVSESNVKLIQTTFQTQVYSVLESNVKLIQMTFQTKKYSVLECVDVPDPSVQLSLLHQLTLTILTCAQSTHLTVRSHPELNLDHLHAECA